MHPEPEYLLRDLKEVKQKRTVIIAGVIGEKPILPYLIYKKTIYPFVGMGGLQ